MSRILFLYERDMPTVSSMKEMFTKIGASYVLSVSFVRQMDVTQSDIDLCDVIILIRPNSSLSVDLARKASKAGCFLIVFYDDDLLNLPKDMPSIPWRKQAMKKVINKSDLVLSSNEYICKKFAQATKTGRYTVLHTAVRVDEIKDIETRSESGDITKIIYAASAGHVALFDKYILPIMNELQEKFSKKISITFIGVRPNLVQYEQKIDITYFSGMPLLQYREFVKSGNYDIGLSPLNEDEFSKCKYFNKYIEYTMAGIVGVYSNCEPYTYVIKDGINGFLADNTKESWLKTLSKVINDGELRRKCLVNAKEQLLSEFNPQTIFDNLIRDIPELFEYSSKREPCGTLMFARIKYKAYRALDWGYLILFYLFRTGISGFINKVKMHVRERKAY